MSIEIIEKPENEDLKKEELELKSASDDLLSEAKELILVEPSGKIVLKSVQEKETAGTLFKMADVLIKKIENHHAPMLENAKDLKSKAEKMRASVIDAIDKLASKPREAKDMLSRAIGEFNAREKAEAERLAKIERERLEKIRLEEADKKQKEADALKAQGKENEAAQVQAEAEAIIDQPEPEIRIQTSEKIVGTKTVTYYSFRIIDETKIPREYLIPDEKKIGNMVRTMKEKTNIPGIQVVSETKTSSTGR